MSRNTTILIIVILLIASSGLVLPVSANSVMFINNTSPFESPYGTISINATVLGSVNSLPVYQGVFDENGSIDLHLQQLSEERQNVTTPDEAPAAASLALEPYGGLPSDAVYEGASTTYSEEYSGDTVVSREPMFTTVFYSQDINGLWVVNDCNSVILTLGSNGELLGLLKVWRDYTYTGDTPIISVNSAISKLQTGDVLNPPDARDENITIDSAALGYYAKTLENNNTELEPIWMFFGNTDYGSRLAFYVYARHFANFTASPTNISMWQTVNFTDISDANPTQWYWDFGDGTNSTLENPTHMYTAAGNYTVNLTAWNNLGSDTESKPDYISVAYQAPLNANFTASPTTASIGDTITFTDESNASPTQWYWDFGDGTNSTLENPTHTYQSGGYYTVNLTAWNSLGNDTLSRVNYIYIYPNAPPVAGFTSNYSYQNAVTPLAVALNDASSGNVTSWYWDFGDGTNSTDQNPVHIFNPSPGSLFGYYTVNLTVTDDVGRTSSYLNYIDVKQAFYPDFTGEPVSGTVPLNVTFTDLTPNSDLAIGNAWDFGDGNNSGWLNPPVTSISYIYDSPGTYNVTLTYYVPAMNPPNIPMVSSASTRIRPNAVMAYDTYTTTKTFYVNATPLQAPVADFSANVTEGKEPLTVAFYDNSTGFPTSWNWTFGDSGNSVSSDQNPVFTYQDPGNYTVTLTAANSDGNSSITKVDYITVLPRYPPVADFTANVTTGASPLAVAFMDNSTNTPTSWYWDFGDGANSTDQNPVHTYSEPGNYSVGLQVTNSDGSDSVLKTDYISVYLNLPVETLQPAPPVTPLANFTANITTGKTPLDVAFTDTSTGFPSSWYWDFGDGANATAQNPVHIYTAAGSYNVSMNATNVYGSNLTTKIDYITVIPLNLPVANFTANETSGITPLAVSFSDESTGSPTSWYWNFGDGTNATVQNPVHVYTTPGTFSVSLNVTNSDGSNTTTQAEYIQVSTPAPLLPNFTANITTGKPPLNVAFTDESTGSPTSWYWTFGDGSNATAQNPVHTYTAAGSYNVSLTATNVYGSNSTTKIDYITVLPLNPPVANFTANVTSGLTPLAVSFTDKSTGSPTSWYWNFGDGANATVQNPVHIYSSAGSFNVSLNVTNSDGSNSTTKTEYIQVSTPAPLVPNFTANITTGKPPLNVAFTDETTGSPTGWNWTFGDGSNSTAQNPVHTYTTAGSYNVSLTATNVYGSNSTTKIDYITVLPLNPPVANFTANVTSGLTPLAVSFTDKSTGSPTSWYWNFGDGTNATVQNPVHIYSSAGSFNVSLNVTNSDGSNSTTKTEYIQVSSIAPPVANFTAKPTCGKAPLSVAFNDTSTGTPTSWYWNFGDGTNSTNQNPTHVYTTSGNYTVSLTASNAGGSNTTTRQNYITVSGGCKQRPCANFEAKPTCGKAPLTVTFTDLSTGSPTSWYWNFGDGTNSTSQNPVHVYTKPGSYTVSLNATNSQGSDTKVQMNYISISNPVQPPVADFSGKPTCGGAPLKVTFTDLSTQSPTSWLWNFGDGKNATSQNPTHIYTTPGKYTVSLIATNSGGNSTKTRVDYVSVSL